MKQNTKKKKDKKLEPFIKIDGKKFMSQETCNNILITKKPSVVKW